RLLETTCLRTLLMKLANGSSVELGQYAAHSSYVVRPSSTSSCRSITALIFSPMSSSKRDHFCGDSTTPSMEQNRFAMTLRISAPDVLRGTMQGVAWPTPATCESRDQQDDLGSRSARQTSDQDSIPDSIPAPPTGYV